MNTSLKTILTASVASLFPLGAAQASEPATSGQPDTVLIQAKKISAPNVDGTSQAAALSASSDSAALLRDVPGVSLYGAGGVSSLPAIHGLADDRLRTQVDGMNLISACANHMNPPLSYIDPSHIGSIQVLNGIGPVSNGGDSIGGTIRVNSPDPEFAMAGEMLRKGQAGAFYRSNGHAHGVNLNATHASDAWSINYAGSLSEAGNIVAASPFKVVSQGNGGKPGLAGDVIGSSAYKSENQSLQMAIRNASQLLELKLGLQNIPYQGFPNQRMDMTGNRSEQLNLRYKGDYAWGQLEARLYHEHTRHSMNFGDDKQFWYGNAPGMPMDTEGKNSGTLLRAGLPLSERDQLNLGIEYQRYRMNDWWSASGTGMMMAPGTFVNIADGQRDRFGMFVEWEANWNPNWFSQIGLRAERVSMNSGPVAGYNAMAYGNPASPLSVPGAFNAANRQRADHNLDFTAVARYTPDSSFSIDGGYAMKTRSPNLYERYTWATSNTMVMNMNNWYGDGNGYAGNLNLKPEIAHTLSATFDWHSANPDQWQFKIAPYYTDVHDYIDAVPCSAASKICPGRKDGFLNLSLSNQNARLYGMDVSASALLLSTEKYGQFLGNAVLNFLHARNKDTGSGLYNIMPLNAKLSLTQHLGHWNTTAEIQMAAAKTDISAVRREMTTPGYTLLNLRSSYTWKQWRFDAGIDNLFNRFYRNPLGGAYLGQGATMGQGVPSGIVVPGMGRSLYAGMQLKF
ncbi:TonB-dependent receptor [Undibacterium griseum]|uniref:TonB-dependent receptor n=1 Tax=Undibacterium griseum TaxID=2762295 RepID=A0ABR6YMY0_9BURK|nr:TonB-dependent receptor [Undibacterium griseum]MBC3885252.1 TonB-dependent receptor [Undibacterium griseum]